MPKSKLIRSDFLPYHLRARANNKEWFYLPSTEVWIVFSSLLRRLCDEFGISIHAFVLMSNHFHALITTPKSNLDQAMLYFMREGSREINRRAGRINHVFGGPYRSSLIDNPFYYENALRYVVQNPVVAGLCKRVESYPFGSLHFQHGLSQPLFPVVESVFDEQGNLDIPLWQNVTWLNQLQDNAQRDFIRRGMRHGLFRIRTTNIPVKTRLILAPRAN